MRISDGDDGLRVEADAYLLTLPRTGLRAGVADREGRAWAGLLLDASLHLRSGLDETVARGEPVLLTGADGWSLTVPLASSLWRRKELRISGDERAIRISAAVEGEGHLADVHLLGAWSSATPATGTGFARSSMAFRTLFSPEPADPAVLARSAAIPSTLDVASPSGPGQGHWFFTPPPYCWAASRAEPRADGRIPEGPWLALGIAASPGQLGFTAAHVEPAERAFSIRLAYEGQTRIVDRFQSPEIVLLPGAANPYAAIAAWADDLRARGLAPRLAPASEGPSWWRAPMFCGWGAQAALARAEGGRAADHATEAAYEAFLGALAAESLVPGTIVIDDRWQAEYGTAAPDRTRWPDLRAWIHRRHEAGQHVLLWWKAWDPAGVPPELCVRNRLGAAAAVDPSNPAYDTFLRSEVRRLLAPDGLDADGLKVDFTAWTPSGPGLRHHGPEWGTSLLLRLLHVIHDEAHRVKPDALVITHSPHPAFVAATDMLRLNDMLRFGEPDDATRVVEQMVHRARIVAAACPGTLIDTDDWAAPDLATWRAWLAAKQEIPNAVLSLYYATTLDRTGERLEPADYAALREAWARARARVPGQARAATSAAVGDSPRETALAMEAAP